MALIPTRTVKQVISTGVEPDAWCEGLDTIVIEAGYHSLPDGNEVLIEQTRSVLNQYGTVMRRDVERWVYEVAGAPPLEYSRDTFASVFLPGMGGAYQFRPLRLVETERIRFFPWNTFTDGVNLSFHRVIAGYVIYDQKPAPANVSSETLAKLVAQGRNPQAGELRRILDSGRLWSEAIRGAEVIETSTARQETVWVDPVVTEVELVFEEADKWSVYRVTKSHIHPGDCQVEGPDLQRKESFAYCLPVPLTAPRVEARSLDAGVRVKVTGGEVQVPCTWAEPVTVYPDRYRVERLTVSEPDRDPDDDPFGRYDTSPADASSSRSDLVEEVDATDLSGRPVASSLPGQEVYTEPGDTSEPPVEYWQVVAEVDRETDPPEAAAATLVDQDVQSGAVYRYRAVALLHADESPPSAEVEVTYGGATSAGSALRVRSRRAADGTLELDCIAPDDPALLAEEYGECLIFDLPVDLRTLAEEPCYGCEQDVTEDGAYETAGEALAEDLARQVMARDRQAGLTVTVELGLPLIVLERGQEISLGASGRPGTLGWDTVGNGLVISEEVERDRRWILDGFKLGASRNRSGRLEGLTTTLTLVEP